MTRKAPAKVRILSFFEKHPRKAYTPKQVANYLKISIHTVRPRIAELIAEKHLERLVGKLDRKVTLKKEPEIPPEPPTKQHYRHYVSEFIYCDQRFRHVVYALTVADTDKSLETKLLNKLDSEYSDCEILKQYGYSIEETEEPLTYPDIETGILE